MKVRGGGIFGSLALSLLLSLGLSSCSGQQQAEEGFEVTDEYSNEFSEDGGEFAEGGNEYAEEEYYNEYSDEEYAEEGYGGYDGGYDSEEYASGGDENPYAINNLVANETESDIQDMISDMNANPAEELAMGESMPMEGMEDVSTDPALTEVAPSGPNAMAVDPAVTAVGDPYAAAAVPAAAGGVSQPGSTPAGAGLPEPNSKMAYIVEPGDTLGKISQKIYGDQTRWKELASLSGLANPSRIYPGDVIYYTLDSAATGFASAYESQQRSETVVQSGDTLATIAGRVYGNPSAWKAIWRQNDRIDNPDKLSPGTVVYYIQFGAYAQNTQNSGTMTAANNTTNSSAGNISVANTVNVAHVSITNFAHFA